MEPGQQTLVELFEGIVSRFPARVAVTADDRELTYRELDRRATAVAQRLRHSGAGTGSLIGLLAPRTSALAVGILGILKSGAAYVPLDPGYPEERIAWTLQDSAVTHLVTTTELADRSLAPDVDVVVLDASETQAEAEAETGAALDAEPASAGAGADDLAYVIHTSGSTGLPKGVQVEHRNVVRLFDVTRDWFGFDETDVWTLCHSAAFDFSVWEFWGALLFGGRLVVVPQVTARSPQTLHALLREQRVTVLSQTPSAFVRLVAADEQAERPLTDLRVVVFGGERLEPAQLRGWFARHGDEHPRLVNMYGITEATVHASYRPVTVADIAPETDSVPETDTVPETGTTALGVSPIGIPLPDLDFHVCDEDGGQVADGTPGELYLSGAGLARGYLGRPELDKERFLELRGPDGTVKRCYRTGDRVVALPDGGYGYLGRTDDQLKIRGYRVEPGEIEAVLLAEADVSAAVAVAHSYGDGDVRVVAYLASDIPADVLAPRLGERAATALPPHMRPSAYVVLRELPLTPNGKVDKSRLPEPTAEAALAPVTVDTADIAGPGEAAGPTATERRIAQIWRSVLDLAEVGLDTDFFDLGGTSLSLLRMFAQTNEEFGTDLDITVLIDGATVSALARHIDSALSAAPPTS
ncbi:amino acid adenylation domain-containing protein [Streptomyces sp. NPDC050732]|uniref:amino acid adenylation domain-containing protein n=1 Tax=Streptomyces sp. NPDC050732 TaxID=3154632 RepID=UPI00342891F3